MRKIILTLTSLLLFLNLAACGSKENKESTNKKTSNPIESSVKPGIKNVTSIDNTANLESTWETQPVESKQIEASEISDPRSNIEKDTIQSNSFQNPSNTVISSTQSSTSQTNQYNLNTLAGSWTNDGKPLSITLTSDGQGYAIGYQSVEAVLANQEKINGNNISTNWYSWGNENDKKAANLNFQDSNHVTIILEGGQTYNLIRN